MLRYQFRSLAAIAFAAVLTGPLSSQAKTSTCSPQFEVQIRDLYYDGSSLSKAKIDAAIDRLKKKEVQISALLAGKEELKADAKGKNANAKKITKAVKKSKSLFALDQAIQTAESMKSATSFAQVCEAATAISDLEGAIRIEGARSPVKELLVSAKSILASWKIPKSSPATDEASNLVGADGSILNASDIAAAVARGVDLSTLQPAKGSVFYTPVQNISKVDVSRAALGSTQPIYAGLNDIFPDDNVFIYESIKKSDTKPKVEATVEGRKDIKYKLKFEAEYNSDPTVGALMMTMGFPSDITKFAKHIKVVLPKDVSIHDVKRDWESYFSRDRVVHGKSRATIESMIESVAKDSKGRTVLTFKEGSIEAHPDAVKRIGGWKYGDGDHNSRREVRGMTLIQMWLDNSDLKEFDNNETLLRENADGSVTRVLMNSDVGHSLGWLYLETPSLYSWNMIKSTSGSTIDFNYRQMHPVSVKHAITLADARWAARLIAQLTREQIAQALQIGGWPPCVQQAYLEKIISRRNDLIVGLGLKGARQADGSVIDLLPVAQDRKAFDIENICKWEAGGKPETEKYGFNAGSFLDPILISAKRQLLELARKGIDGEKRLVLKSKDFHWNGPRPIGDLIFNVERQIERNPAPKTEQDLFIVKDTLELGIRAGIAIGAYADVVERHSWELAYPARSKEEASMNNGFIVNLLLPRDVREGKLPESYVLKTEHSFEVGAGIQAEFGGAVSPVLQAGSGVVKAWRSIYDHRDGKKAILYRDRHDYTQTELDFFARLAILKIPVLEQVKQWGHALGKGVILSADDLKNPVLEAAVDHAVVEGDFSALASRETEFFSNDEFEHSLRKWSLLLWSIRSEKRLDRIEIDTDKQKNIVQFKTSKGSKFSFVTTGVEKNVAVEVFADPAAPSDLEIQVNVMGMDAATSDKEMANKYLRFVNGLSANGSPVLDLTPSLGYTTNGMWGATLTQSSTTYSVEATKRILSASPEAFWTALAQSMKLSRPTLDAMRAGADRTHAQDIIIDHAQDYLRHLAKAQSQTTLEQRVKKLAEAVRKAIFIDRTGFYNPSILGALNRIAGENTIYSRNLITVPEPLQVNLPEGAPLFGKIGSPLKSSLTYLIFAPVSATDLYNMFDTWF